MNEGLKQHVISVDIRKVFDKIHAVYDKQNSKKVRYRRNIHQNDNDYIYITTVNFRVGGVNIISSWIW